MHFLNIFHEIFIRQRYSICRQSVINDHLLKTLDFIIRNYDATIVLVFRTKATRNCSTFFNFSRRTNMHALYRSNDDATQTVWVRMVEPHIYTKLRVTFDTKAI